MTPGREKTFLSRLSHQIPRPRLGRLKGFLSWHGALQGPSTRIVHCFRNYIEARPPYKVCRAKREGPRTLSRTADANLNCAFVENALFYTDP